MNFNKFYNYCKDNLIIDSTSDVSSYIIKCKNGNKIHIKKKNRGSFTRYCGGNVTLECINKAKKSQDPKIRKKATFADNARHWNKK